jgi:hypothetical protein
MRMLLWVPQRLARHILWLLRNNFALTDKWGYHIREIHYYEPLPDFRNISKGQDELRDPMRGVDLRVPEQLGLIDRLAQTYAEELSLLAREQANDAFDFANDYFSYYDAAVHYAMIREIRPRRLLEVGSGYSTRIAAKAIAKNEADCDRTSIIAIEPYPQPRLLEAKLDLRLIELPVQEVDEREFRELESGDLLFVDSSHTAKFRSDVCHLFLKIFPVLASGVWVHIHDIFLPFDYPSEWLIERRLAFNEQYLLHAFLINNPEWEIVLCNYLLSVDHPDRLRRIFDNDAARHSKPSSLWLRKR